MRIKANWDAGPKILMVNALSDGTISNLVARNTMIASDGSTKVEMIVTNNGTHETPLAGCDAASNWRNQWVEYYVYKLGTPPTSTDHANACWNYGPQPGGTSFYPHSHPSDTRPPRRTGHRRDQRKSIISSTGPRSCRRGERGCAW